MHMFIEGDNRRQKKRERMSSLKKAFNPFVCRMKRIESCVSGVKLRRKQVMEERRFLNWQRLRGGGAGGHT